MKPFELQAAPRRPTSTSRWRSISTIGPQHITSHTNAHIPYIVGTADGKCVDLESEGVGSEERKSSVADVVLVSTKRKTSDAKFVWESEVIGLADSMTDQAGTVAYKQVVGAVDHKDVISAVDIAMQVGAEGVSMPAGFITHVGRKDRWNRVANSKKRDRDSSSGRGACRKSIGIHGTA